MKTMYVLINTDDGSPHKIFTTIPTNHDLLGEIECWKTVAEYDDSGCEVDLGGWMIRETIVVEN